MKAAQFERAEVNIPDAVIDLLQADLFLGAAHADIDPFVIPANATVVADESFLAGDGAKSGNQARVE